MHTYKFAQQLDGSFNAVWLGWKRMENHNSQEVYSFAVTTVVVVIVAALLILFG